MLKKILVCLALLSTSVASAESCMSEADVAIYYRASEMELERGISHPTALLLVRYESVINTLAMQIEKDNNIPHSFAVGHAEAMLLATLAESEMAKAVHEAYAIQQLVCGRVPGVMNQVSVAGLKQIGSDTGPTKSEAVAIFKQVGLAVGNCTEATSQYYSASQKFFLRRYIDNCEVKNPQLSIKQCVTLAEESIEIAEKIFPAQTQVSEISQNASFFMTID